MPEATESRGGYCRAALLILIVGFGTFLSGCKTARSPGAENIPPPIDPSREHWEAEAANIKSMRTQFPAKQEYRIGPGDIISITLVGRSDIFGKNESGRELFRYTVTEDPVVTMPYIGGIDVHGKTPEELQEEIRQAYSQLIKDPMPIVTVEKFYFNQITVLGSVRTPGKYDLKAGDTVIESIFKAGGLTFGGGSNGLPPAPVLKVFRDKLDRGQRLTLTPEEIMQQLDENGQIETREEIVLPLEKFIMGGDLTYNLPLQPNDIVYVPPAGTVTMHGNVRNPRVVFLGPGLRSLAQVITETGGLRYRADSDVEIVRTNPDGTTQSYFVDARKVMKRKTRDFTLQDNDQVFVYTHPTRNVLDVVASVFRATATTGVNATYSPGP